MPAACVLCHVPRCPPPPRCRRRIFYDNHHDICRLSKRRFPRAAEVDMGCSAALARKRSGDEGDVAVDVAAAHLAKRCQSGEWAAAQAAAQWTAQQQQQQQQQQTGWPQ